MINMGFKTWLEQTSPSPSSELEKAYLDMLSKQYKPTTVAALYKNNAAKFFDPHNMFGIMFDIVYNELRTPKDLKSSTVKYPKDSDIESYTRADNKLVYVRDENNWHYRIPHDYNVRKKQFPDGDDRVSFAGLPVRGLVDALDQFVQHRVAYYKTPNQLAGWEDRHDPVTIYFKEPVTKDVKAELSALLSKFNRDKYIPAKMDGDVFDNGLAHQKSPSVGDIQKIVAAASAVHPDLGKTLTEKFKRDKEVKASAGQITAALELIKMVKQLGTTKTTPQPQTPAAPGQISVSSLEQKFGAKPGTLDISKSKTGEFMFVRNRVSGTSISVKPDVAAITAAAQKVLSS